MLISPLLWSNVHYASLLILYCDTVNRSFFIVMFFLFKWVVILAWKLVNSTEKNIFSVKLWHFTLKVRFQWLIFTSFRPKLIFGDRGLWMAYFNVKSLLQMKYIVAAWGWPFPISGLTTKFNRISIFPCDISCRSPWHIFFCGLKIRSGEPPAALAKNWQGKHILLTAWYGWYWMFLLGYHQFWSLLCP